MKKTKVEKTQQMIKSLSLAQRYLYDAYTLTKTNNVFSAYVKTKKAVKELSKTKRLIKNLEKH